MQKIFDLDILFNVQNRFFENRIEKFEKIGFFRPIYKKGLFFDFLKISLLTMKILWDYQPTIFNFGTFFVNIFFIKMLTKMLTFFINFEAIFKTQIFLL